MIELLARLFIRSRDALAPSALRRAYGQLCGAVGIGLNLLLFAVKFFAGSVSGSIAITADAFNNLSDAGSSLVTLLGFRLAGRKPDPEHPFGHGRMEYISGLVVSGLILLMGVELGKSSLGKILHPEEVASSPLVLVILAVSIGVKLYMFSYNRAVGKKIHSTAMDATAMDSLSDAVSTAAFTLAPGPHRFEARFGQGSGGAGPSNTAKNTEDKVLPTFGIGLDRQGRTELRASNFEALADPGDGSLFTTAPGALPLADPTATTATLTGPFAFTGTWTVDMAQIRAGGRLVVTDGALDLSAVTEVVFANTEDLKKGGVYVLAESADGFVPGETPPALAGLPAGPWRLEVYGKTLRLAYPASTAIILR